MKKMRAHATKGWEIRCIIINVQEHDDAIPRRFQDSDVAENTMREHLEVRHLSNDRDPDVIEVEDHSLVTSVIHRMEGNISIELEDVIFNSLQKNIIANVVYERKKHGHVASLWLRLHCHEGASATGGTELSSSEDRSNRRYALPHARPRSGCRDGDVDGR